MSSFSRLIVLGDVGTLLMKAWMALLSFCLKRLCRERYADGREVSFRISDRISLSRSLSAIIASGAG